MLVCEQDLPLRIGFRVLWVLSALWCKVLLTGALEAALTLGASPITPNGSAHSSLKLQVSTPPHWLIPLTAFKHCSNVGLPHSTPCQSSPQLTPYHLLLGTSVFPSIPAAMKLSHAPSIPGSCIHEMQVVKANESLKRTAIPCS